MKTANSFESAKHAASFQDPMARYGEENLDFFKIPSKDYDSAQFSLGPRWLQALEMDRVFWSGSDNEYQKEHVITVVSGQEVGCFSDLLPASKRRPKHI